MGIYVDTITIIELDANDAGRNIEGFPEMHQLISDQLQKGAIDKFGDVASEANEMIYELQVLAYDFKTNGKFDTQRQQPPLNNDGLRIIELYKSIVEDLYSKVQLVFEFRDFKPNPEAYLDERSYAYGFEVEDVNTLLNDPSELRRVESICKCTIESYTDVN